MENTDEFESWCLKIYGYDYRQLCILSGIDLKLAYKSAALSQTARIAELELAIKAKDEALAIAKRELIRSYGDISKIEQVCDALAIKP